MMHCQIINNMQEFDHNRYHKEGVAVLKNYLTENTLFQAYRRELLWCARMLLKENGKTCPPTLEQSLLELHHTNSKDVQAICHLNTLPNKLISGAALKDSEKLTSIARHIFGKEAVLGSPAGSDTLHVFAADPLFDKFILPIHQDYPYLLHSPEAITLWIPMVPFAKDVGGIYSWPGSHATGIRPTTKSASGHFETIIDNTGLTAFPRLETPWDLGDVVVMDTHMLHQGIANRNPDHLRVTQLFRYANLNHPDAIAGRWRSAVFARTAITFEELHPEHYVKPVAYEPRRLFN